MSRRVLVTGSEGFTGVYVCQELRAGGWDVWGAGLTAKSDDPRYIKIDLQNAASLEQIAAIRPDVVIHLAAMAFVAEPDPAPFYHINLLGTRNLLEALCRSKHPPDCTIIASSANVYGNAQAGILSEDIQPNPVNDYAVSKLAMEYLARTYMDRLGIVITRPFNYTGVGQSDRFLIPKIVDHFRRRAPSINLGNLNVERDYSDVRDIARYYRLLSERQPIGATLNLCSSTTSKISEILALLEKNTQHRLEVISDETLRRRNEVHSLFGDNARLAGITGSQTLISLESTLHWMVSSVA